MTTVTVRKDDLRLLMEYAGWASLTVEARERLNGALARCGEALDSAPGDGGLPAGEWMEIAEETN